MHIWVCVCVWAGDSYYFIGSGGNRLFVCSFRFCRIGFWRFKSVRITRAHQLENAHAFEAIPSTLPTIHADRYRSALCLFLSYEICRLCVGPAENSAALVVLLLPSVLPMCILMWFSQQHACICICCRSHASISCVPKTHLLFYKTQVYNVYRHNSRNILDTSMVPNRDNSLTSSIWCICECMCRGLHCISKAFTYWRYAQHTESSDEYMVWMVCFGRRCHRHTITRHPYQHHHHLCRHF